MKYLMIRVFLALLLFAACRSNDIEPQKLTYQEILNKYHSQGLSGVVALIKKPGEEKWVGAAGFSNVEQAITMSTQSILYGASVGKLFCAVAVLKLVESGVIALDDLAHHYLPDNVVARLPNGHTVTIRQLLSHRSGIPNFDLNPAFHEDIRNDPFGITTSDLTAYEFDQAPLFPAGQGHRYSSTGYEVLAQVIDKVTGLPHQQYYTSAIIEPLGLQHTFYKDQAGYPNPQGLVKSYFDVDENGTLDDVSAINNHLTNILTGSDGIIASVEDYDRFLTALFNGKLLSPTLFEQMTTWNETNDPNYQSGLGLFRGKTPYGFRVGHVGGSLGAGIDVFYFPDSDTTIITATNVGTFIQSSYSDTYKQFYAELLDAVFAQ